MIRQASQTDALEGIGKQIDELPAKMPRMTSSLKRRRYLNRCGARPHPAQVSVPKGKELP